MKLNLHERFIINDQGKPTGVILTMHDYHKLVELVEDLEDIRYIKKHKRDSKITLDKFVQELKEEKLV